MRFVSSGVRLCVFGTYQVCPCSASEGVGSLRGMFAIWRYRYVVWSFLCFGW